MPRRVASRLDLNAAPWSVMTPSTAMPWRRKTRGASNRNARATSVFISRSRLCVNTLGCQTAASISRPTPFGKLRVRPAEPQVDGDLLPEHAPGAHRSSKRTDLPTARSRTAGPTPPPARASLKPRADGGDRLSNHAGIAVFSSLLQVSRLELRELTQPSWRKDPQAPSPQRDHPVPPQGLQHAIHMNARQTERIGEIQLRQRQVVLAVRGLAD